MNKRGRSSKKKENCTRFTYLNAGENSPKILHVNVWHRAKTHASMGATFYLPVPSTTTIQALNVKAFQILPSEISKTLF